ncbi:MAG TPA: glycine cleavage system aminomethyltransferase GcvT [Saprospiraceae bacterium]|nr:glycine cleavage system aminomethyltransferase GcvT [Saprospiraceae bacterium]
MKNTPLTEKHIALGAKMAEFAGYNMPISYSGIKEEHEAVRTNAGIFDVSHMGEFIVKGKEALKLVQKITSNDASKLAIGEAQYSCMPNNDGGIVDDLLVYRLAEDMCNEGEQAFMLVVNASNMEKDWNWISSHNSFDTRLINISDQTGLIAIQGPKVAEMIQELTSIDLKNIPYYTFKKGSFAGCDNVIISATGYTGAGGFELYASNEDTSKIWDAIMAIGSPKGLLPAGLGARDTLRLEMAFCLYGNDIDDTTSPLEAGLAWITKLDKDDFVGKSWMMDQKKAGLSKKLVGFIMDDRRIPRHGYKVLNDVGVEIGVVTSGTQSPSLNLAIGLAYVPVENAKIGSSLQINMGSRNATAHVVKIPFIKS